MKKRLDVYLVENNFFNSREQAKTMIMLGNIFINNQRVDKPGHLVNINDKIDIRADKIKYVSRGGLKLEKAIEKFEINLHNKICLDVGASTGGFTDCMLQKGASKVYSLDVGYGQLAWNLRNDDRVVNMERTNIRYLNKSTITDIIDFVSIDVSFISLKLVLPIIKNILKSNGESVCLIKPQFEAGKNQVGKNGVIRNIEIHKKVIRNVLDFIKNYVQFTIKNFDYSPLKGPAGNIEYLVYIKNTISNLDIDFSKIYNIIDQSHKILLKK